MKYQHLSTTLAVCAVLLIASSLIEAQSLTTGGLGGTVTDQNRAFIQKATVTATSRATSEIRLVTTDTSGRFSFSLLQPGIYHLRVEAVGFARADVDVLVTLADASNIDVVLAVAGIIQTTDVVSDGAALVRSDTSTMGQTVGSRTIETVPLPTRNFTQLVRLVPGASSYLTDATNLGHNTNAIAVNGIRPTQNNFQINGVDANAGVMRDIQFGMPAPESIAELKVQTSNYDATFGRAGGGSIQVVTKSGSNELTGSVYYYFSDTSFNANDPFLKAAGHKRPVLVRNVYGGTIGGPIHKDRVFFFASYQGSRERNGFSKTNSLRTGIFIDELLTDDRSDTTLRNAYGLQVIDEVASRLLNARLPDGRFVIPTPGEGGYYSTSEVSRSAEDQFNANLDVRLTKDNWLAAKFFFADSPQFLAFAGTTLPGFGQDQERRYGILSLQDVHSFSGSLINEARFGYNYIREDVAARQPLDEMEIGINRSNSGEYPGFTFLTIGGDMTVGPSIREDLSALPSMSFTDTVSMQFGDHSLRIGGDVRLYRYDLKTNRLTRGTIDVTDFHSFLMGNVRVAGLANGILDRDMRTQDYHFFLQDDWRIRRDLVINLGLRYELDLPLYETQGRLSTFDPTLYRPPTALVGPPAGGIVQAGNAEGALDLPEIPNVDPHVLYGLDRNNFAPRLGIVYSPFGSGAVVLRAAYGVFYSRPSFQYAVLGGFQPPYYFADRLQGSQLANPFPTTVPPRSAFPILVQGPLLFGNFFDRGIRTPYSQQWNGSLQFAIAADTMFEAAYVGTRGLNLFRQYAINQAYLMGPLNPITNPVTGMPVLSNTPANAQLRAPYQGASVSAAFSSNQTTAQSTYHSAQFSVNRRFSRGLQFLVSYTYSKSIDTASGTGGGSTVNGSLLTDMINDSSFPDGDQRDIRSSRGVSDFDRTHQFVASYLWEIPISKKAPKPARWLLSGWQLSGVLAAMSGLPINIRDARGGELFFGPNGGGDRPSWISGATAASAFTNIPAGYYFNPFAFRRAVVSSGQQIPSSPFQAFAAPACPVINNAFCTDFGNVGRNPLRGPRQINFDVALARQFRISEKRELQVRVEAFNVFNTVNLANPVSNFNATVDGGEIDNTTGTITEKGSFGQITSTSSNPRILQIAIKMRF